jgi:hypothetical protein
MGTITVKPPDPLQPTTITDDGWLRLGIGNFADSTFGATIKGDAAQPIAATLSSPHGESVAVDATIKGDATQPVVAKIEGNSDQPIAATVNVGNSDNKPLQATVTASIGGTDVPVQLAPVDANLNGSVGVNATLGGSGAPLQLAPIKLDIGHLLLRLNIVLEFRLFGVHISSIRISGNAEVNP